MRYLFRGLRRDNGEPVEGRVTAPDRDAAYHILGDHGFVAERLEPDPVQPQDPAASARSAQVAKALESALDEAGLPVSFDALTRRYQGKQVWVLDRNKIRQRVMTLVDEVIAASMHDEHESTEARARIASLLERMFDDRRNLGSSQPAVEAQVQHLTSVVGQIEKTIASMSVAAQRGARGDRGRIPAATARDKQRDAVLVEVFESNLALIRALNDPASPPAQEKDR